MADRTDIVPLIKGWLEGGTGVTVYDGFVPERVPQVGDWISPYVLLEIGVGAPIQDPSLTQEVEAHGRRVDFTTKAVGYDTASTRTLAQMIRTSIENRLIGRGIIIPNPDGFQQETPLFDRSSSPTRFMLPEPWRLETNL